MRSRRASYGCFEPPGASLRAFPNWEGGASGAPPIRHFFAPAWSRSPMGGADQSGGSQLASVAASVAAPVKRRDGAAAQFHRERPWRQAWIAKEVGYALAGAELARDILCGPQVGEGAAQPEEIECLVRQARFGNLELYRKIIMYSVGCLRKYYAEWLPPGMVDVAVRETIYLAHMNWYSCHREVVFEDWLLGFARYKCTERIEKLLQEAKLQRRRGVGFNGGRLPTALEMFFPTPKPHHNDYMFL